MKKLLLLIPALLLGSCVLMPSKKTSESTETTPTTTTITSTIEDTSNTSTDNTDEEEPEPGTDPAPELTKQTIHEIKTEKKIGQLVKFEATYLRCLTWTNEDLMYFADATDYIWLRVPYANYTGYLANRYRMKEYTVVGKVAEVNNVIELVFDSTTGNKNSVINLGDNYPLSYSKITTPVSLTGISKIKEKCGDIVLNNKGHGAGEVVKFTSQIVETTYNDANKKAMVLDPDGNSITVIGDGKKMVNESDIGKYYEWVGIISIEDTIPAILGIECSYVSHSPEEENSIDVSSAEEVSPSYFAKWSLLGTSHNERNPASLNDYFKLYKSSGYLVNNTKYNSGNRIGLTDSFGQSISDSSTGNYNASTKTIKGFYLVNYDNEDVLHSPIKDYIGANTKVTLYYSIRDFNTTDHLWKMFVVESKTIIEMLND